MTKPHPTPETESTIAELELRAAEDERVAKILAQEAHARMMSAVRWRAVARSLREGPAPNRARGFKSST